MTRATKNRPFIKLEFREFGKPRKPGGYRHEYDVAKLHLEERTRDGKVRSWLLCRGSSVMGEVSTHVVWILWLYGGKRAWRGEFALRVRL